MKRNITWYYKYTVLFLRNYFLHRSFFFYSFFSLVLALGASILYGSWWVVELIYDLEMKLLLSKTSLIFLIFTVGISIFMVIIVILRIVWHRFQNRQGTRLRFRLVFSFIVITVVPSFLYVYALDYILQSTLNLFFKDQTIIAYELSLNQLKKTVNSIQADTKSFLDAHGNEFYTGFQTMSFTKQQENIFENSDISLIGVLVSNRLVYHTNKEQTKGQTKTLISRLTKMAAEKKFVKEHVHYDLNYNYVLANKPLAKNKNITVVALTIPNPLLPKEITSTMSTITRLAQMKLLSLPIKNMLLFLYFSFYFPVLSLGILIFYLGSKSISTPIGKLNDAVKSISRDNFNFKIMPQGDDEISDLVRSFKYMTKELLFNRDKLRRLSQVEAWRDVAIRLAHELKNPLTPIKLANDRIGKKVMKFNFDLYSELLPSFNLINREINVIGGLIKQFSEYSKEIKINKSIVDMRSFVETIKDYLTHHNNFEWNFANTIQASIKSFVDEMSLRQVINNLIGNAMDSIESLEKGKIDIKAKGISDENSSWVEIQISNNGPGIPDNLKDKIFEPYFTTKEMGTGLGLSVCEQIVAKHEGNLTFTSDEKETVFTVQIPVLNDSHA